MTYRMMWLRTAVPALVAAVALAGVGGCAGRDAAGHGEAAGPATELTAEEQALTDLGYRPEAVIPGYEPGDPDRRGKRHGKHRHLGKRVLHGELVVSTKDGTRTIVVQRGEITAVDDDSMTVKSSDGFTLTWTYGKKLRVVERRRTVDGEALDVGDQVGVAGGKDGSGPVARLILISQKK